MLHVGEAHFLQGPGAAAVVLEVDLLEGLGGDLLEFGVAGAGVLGVEEPAAYCGGRAMVRCRMRSWSVDPIGAV
ncbi:hypothetical protein Shyd_68660 [Streptomyces hydrogenans]|uniref:Uncharacterized protein n=1 Tax=Streptomyces hydrogenans TaxID=1873719 RepID=A0ABQ3PKF0_9ACTN|nr:hypothetical protein Shyd_68660 [Streptomyces hydrogenans]